jgi:homoserine O-acetyltransferase
MKDEYGVMDDSGETFSLDHFTLESGETLKDVQVRYRAFGRLNDARDNVIVVCHALTGNAQLDQWWGTMLGPGKVMDTDKYLVVCANVLGGCYGTTGPQSINPDTGRPYGMDFPDVTIRDSVKLHHRMLLDGVGAQSVRAVIGGSMGGMQALEWVVEGKSYVRSAVIIGCGAAHSAWQIAISETQRQAIYADPAWKGGYYLPEEPPRAGLAVARQIAMVSYRTASGYARKFGRRREKEGAGAGAEAGAGGQEIATSKAKFQARNYLEYQGHKFVGRFDPVTYVKLTEQMDSHDIGRGRAGDLYADATSSSSSSSSLGGRDATGGLPEDDEILSRVLGATSAQCMVVGIDSDILYPLAEQQKLAQYLPHAMFRLISSPEGHDAFLLEHGQVGGFIAELLAATEVMEEPVDTATLSPKSKL